MGAIGDGPRDALVGFDASGAMCIRAFHGAIRGQQQLSGQSLLIPQPGDIFLFNGQLDNLRSSAGHCACELQIAKATSPRLEVSELATAEDARKQAATAKPNAQPETVDPPLAKEEPIYQVFMPPLVYAANATGQPEIHPQMIILVRRMRVRPTLIFQGRVERAAVAAVTQPPTAAKPAKPAPRGR